MCVTVNSISYSNSWHSRTGEMLKCPVDGCEHKAEIITKAHLMLNHGLSREETKKIYGMPIVAHKKQGFDYQISYKQVNSVANSSVIVYVNKGFTNKFSSLY